MEEINDEKIFNIWFIGSLLLPLNTHGVENGIRIYLLMIVSAILAGAYLNEKHKI